MCIYVLSVPLCGHTPSLLFGPSCPEALSQLDRILEPASWEPPGLHEVPFRLPDACLPSERNIAVVRAADFCSACRVEYGRAESGRDGRARGRGCEDGGCPRGRWPGLEMFWEPERIGVGWRT